MCDTGRMQRTDEVARVREALRRVMERKGIKPKPLAQRARLGDTSVRDFLDNDDRDIKIGTLHKLAGALDIPIEELVGTNQVAIAGRIGAGGSVIYAEAPDGFVPRAPGVGGDLEALEVQGDSMLPRYSSGDVVYISRSHDGALDEYLGEYCAVRLVTGETYLKILARGSRPGFFTLRSLNAADIEDVEIEWATPVMAVLPRVARRRLGV